MPEELNTCLGLFLQIRSCLFRKHLQQTLLILRCQTWKYTVPLVDHHLQIRARLCRTSLFLAIQCNPDQLRNLFSPVFQNLIHIFFLRREEIIERTHTDAGCLRDLGNRHMCHSILLQQFKPSIQHFLSILCPFFLRKYPFCHLYPPKKLLKKSTRFCYFPSKLPPCQSLIFFSSGEEGKSHRQPM